MAAGLVYHNLTTAAGVTFTVAKWVPDTTVPNANAMPVHAILKPDGTPIDFGAGAATTATVRVSVGTDQLSPLATAYDILNNLGGGQKIYFPTDQPAPIKVQALANGQTNSRVVAAATTNATSLKASAGNIFDIDVFNTAAYDVFLKLYNKASAPTVGTDVPVRTIPIKSGAGYARSFPFGKSFATGIAYAITKLQPDTDATVLVAGDVTGSIDWI